MILNINCRESAIIELMEKRGFDLVKVKKPEFIKSDYIFVCEDVICEVYKETGDYEFVYTNDNIFGVLKTGILFNLRNEEGFNKNLFAFIKTLQKLKY